MNVSQVIGCAYTYEGSLGIRKKLTVQLKEQGIHHSSQVSNFSYFYKGDSTTIVGNGGELRLMDKNAVHWPEAELALILGKGHEIVGYTLANDFTAIGIEVKGRTKNFDGTYFGKVWKGSCSLGPRIVSPDEIQIDNLEILLRIERYGEVIYDNTYNTQRRKREFKELADMVTEYHKKFGSDVPPSKRIQTENDFLIEGTVLLTGTGLIVPQRCYSQAGDFITIYSQPIGELRNRVA